MHVKVKADSLLALLPTAHRRKHLDRQVDGGRNRHEELRGWMADGRKGGGGGGELARWMMNGRKRKQTGKGMDGQTA